MIGSHPALRVVAMAAVAAVALVVAVDAQQRLGARDVDALPSKVADAREAYGSEPLQFGDLRVPAGRGPFPVAIVIHGGCWVSRFASLENTAAMADALRTAGVATWNIEYRRVDHAGGGWPGTFTDVAAGADHLRELARKHPLDLKRVVAVGHSAGAPLALWLGARHRLPAGSPLRTSGDPLPLRAVVALGGPGDLRDFNLYASSICGAPVIDELFGGSPAAVPDRYAQGSPVELLPFGIPQVLLVGEDDSVMPERARDAYTSAARAAGDQIQSLVVPGGHFEVIAPTSTAWPTVRREILTAAGADRKGGN